MNSTSTNQILSVKHDVTLITENKIKTLALYILDQQVTQVGSNNDCKHNDALRFIRLQRYRSLTLMGAVGIVCC